MSKHLKKQIEGQCSLAIATDIEALYRIWQRFLDDVGNYTKRIYLLEDLSMEVHNPQSEVVLARYYDNDLRTLKLVIQQDIDCLEGHIIALYQTQKRLGMDSFRVTGDTLSQFIDNFSRMELMAPRRRAFYRRRIKRELNKLSPLPLSLHDLEAAFKRSAAYQKGLAEAAAYRASK